MARYAGSDILHHTVVGGTLFVVVGGIISVIVRTSTGSGSTTNVMDVGNLFVLVLAATPSLFVVLLTRRWRISLAQCLLAIVAWAPLLGSVGDTSCVDCGFVLLWPMTVGVVQLALLPIAWFSPSLRSC